MSGELAGKVAIVTGASRRSGRATAIRLAQHGAAVIVNARNAGDEIEAVAAEIRAAGGKALAHLADVTDEHAVAGMAARASAEFGGIDILVNNAAIRMHSSFTEMSYAEWRSVTGIILDGAFLCSRAVIPSMLARGGGSIVNIGGLSGHVGAFHRAHVITAKAGLVGLTKALATEFGQQKIRVNCVVPGRIGGERSVTAGELPPTNNLSRPALGRDGDVEEVADVVLTMILPATRYVTGQTIHVNGGLYLP